MWRIAALYSTLGLEMGASLAIGLLGGQWLDAKLGTAPYLFWFGFIVGLGAAGRAVVRAIRTARQDGAPPV